MQGWLDPIGPLPASAYWTRRVLVGVLVVALAVLVGVGVSRLRGDRAVVGTPTTSNSVSADASVPVTAVDETAVSESEPVPPASEETTPQEPAAAESEAESTPAEPVVAACEPAALTVRVDGQSPVRSGEPVALSVVLTTSEEHCTVDLAATDAQLVVASGADHIWATGDCPDWHPQGTLDVLKDQEVPFEVTWPVQRASGCELASTALGAGTYVATASVGSASGRFVMQVQAA
ncbi:hypothetical protein GCM10009785_24480 [Brooklawnia cerclae]|uniref:Muc19 n=1 Tax=Brooklawnia cerclae TaxID=349934 RepID=A0ABX0SCE0_9ACTN|nr:hypothetical protein [Brooklawnia cerclae]NIH55589.1 hypothetical protein [Brooklawnia cerclae]